jgi:acyl carrier protein
VSDAPIPGAEHLPAIAALLEDHLGVPAGQITPISTLSEDLNADELDLLEIIITAECHYEVDISNDEAEALVTVADLCALLATKRAVPTPYAAPKQVQA